MASINFLRGLGRKLGGCLPVGLNGAKRGWHNKRILEADEAHRAKRCQTEWGRHIERIKKNNYKDIFIERSLKPDATPKGFFIYFFFQKFIFRIPSKSQSHSIHYESNQRNSRQINSFI